MWKFLFCLPFCLAANGVDFRKRKIPNRLILLLLGSGAVLRLCLEGGSGLAGWACGLLPAFVLLPFFALRMLGAGDIKLLAALGGVLGARAACVLLAASFLVSGTLGVGILVVKKSFRRRFEALGQYLRACFLTRSVLPYDQNAAEEKFAFSYGITGGLALTAYYFLKTGGGTNGLFG